MRKQTTILAPTMSGTCSGNGQLATVDGYAAVADALTGASEADLDRSLRPGEWTARTVVHHLADSETHAYVRLRRLIAEDDPTIIGYDEVEYARRLHYDRPIAASLEVLRAVREASIYAGHSHDHAEQIRGALSS